ncbi:MAG: YdcF family protein [Christensenellales bacterium]|nr:YdcF family protein [Christensenellales bacterium]
MSRPFDAIVLLGYELEADGQPAKELLARVQAAKAAYAQGLSARIVASGGVTQGRSVAESSVMARLLVQAGVPRQAIVEESQSQTTMENMRFSREKLGGAAGLRVLIVTSDYHLRRAVWTARRAGMHAKGYAAALEHDAQWKKRRNQELAYTVDLLMGWQDEGKSRPDWTYRLFDRVFGARKTPVDR